jgi:hypothetical protein
MLHTLHHPSSSGSGTNGTAMSTVIVDSVPFNLKKRKNCSIAQKIERFITTGVRT